MTRALSLLLAACSLQATTYSVTIAGLAGEPEYEQRFAQWAGEIDKILKASGAEVESEAFHGPAATRDQLRSSLASIAKKTKPGDSLALFVIGHGTFDGQEYKLNLPGPDVSATELASLLDRVPHAAQLIVNMTSASGGSFHALQKPGRAIITGTKSGTEKNATVFARYWVEALRDASADVDKNEVISALEAFRYAEQKTKQFYESQKRLMTEHATINGGEAEMAPLAGRFALLRMGSIQEAAKDPAKQELLRKREEIERQIDSLKMQKAAMPTDEYKKQLSAILLELARTQEAIDK